MSRSCVIVGAGAAGLAAAYRLANAGVRVTLLEAAAQIGGRARTELVSGCVLDPGAHFLNPDCETTLGLLQELRLETVSPKPFPAMVATPFGKLPLDLGSTRELLRFPLLPWSGKLRALWLSGRVSRRRSPHFADLESLARLDRGETAEGWGRRAAGDAGYNYLIRPALERFFRLDAAETSCALGRTLIRRTVTGGFLVLRGGIGSLGEGLAQRLEIRTGCWVSGVEKGESGVAVHHSGGTVEADHVVFACPANAITRIEGDIAAEDRAALSAVRYAPAMNLFFGYERSITVQHPVVMAAGPDRHPVATVWTTSRWIPEHVPEGKEVVCIQPASWRSGELLELDPAKVVSAIRAEAEEVFGRLADPDWIRLYPWPGGLVLPVPGHYRRMSELVRRPRERIHFAGDWITGSSVEGALRTGLQAAERILASAS